MVRCANSVGGFRSGALAGARELRKFPRGALGSGNYHRGYFRSALRKENYDRGHFGGTPDGENYGRGHFGSALSGQNDGRGFRSGALRTAGNDRGFFRGPFSVANDHRGSCRSGFRVVSYHRGHCGRSPRRSRQPECPSWLAGSASSVPLMARNKVRDSQLGPGQDGPILQNQLDVASRGREHHKSGSTTSPTQKECPEAGQEAVFIELSPDMPGARFSKQARAAPLGGHPCPVDLDEPLENARHRRNTAIENVVMRLSVAPKPKQPGLPET